MGKPLILLLVAVLLVLVAVPVQGKTYADDFSQNTSMFYGGDTTLFKWDTNNGTLSLRMPPAGKQLYKNDLLFGNTSTLYKIDIRGDIIKSGTNYTDIQLIINSQSNSTTGYAISTGNKNFIYGRVYNGNAAFRFYRVIAGSYVSLYDGACNTILPNQWSNISIFAQKNGSQSDYNLYCNNVFKKTVIDATYNGGYSGIGVDAGINYYADLADNLFINETATANFTSTLSGKTLTTLQDGTNFNDPGVESWWKLGNGAVVNNTPPTSYNLSYTYPWVGTYEVELHVKNIAGTNITTQTVDVLDPPTANFEANITSGHAPLAVQFTNTSSGTVLAFNWSFGEGNSSTAVQPSITYWKPGFYTVNMSATGLGTISNVTKWYYIVVYPEGYTIPNCYGNASKFIESSDQLYDNKTYIRSDNPSTPIMIFIVMFAAGLLLLLASLILKPEHCNDIIGYIAPIPLLFSTIMAMAIDIKTSSGSTSIVQDDFIKLLIIENHTIYTPTLLIIFLIILFMVSVLNVVRIYKQHRELQSGEDES